MPSEVVRAHVIVGGFPMGALAGHDMDFVRHQLLGILQEFPKVKATVANDYSEIDRWLSGTDMLLTYTAGPYATDEQAEAIESWMLAGGRWFALHGSSGGKAVKRQTPDGMRKSMVKAQHHQAIGCFFLNHPPIRRFTVNVAQSHPLTEGLDQAFEVTDELYLVELQDPDTTEILLTTELESDPSPPGFGFTYERDTSLLSDGKTRALGYEKAVGKGGVAYMALGHCHHPLSNSQPFVDESVSVSGEPPNPFRGSWDSGVLPTLVRNGVRWAANS